MKTYKINEIFTSIQGEGPRVGRLAVFVRFSGCVRTCSFCDTRHSTWEDYDLEKILAVLKNETRRFSGDMECVLTGGEPLLQVDPELLRELFEQGYHVSIETSGDRLISEMNADFQRLMSELRFGVADLIVSPKDLDYSPSILGLASCLKVLCPLLFEERALEGMVAALSRRGGICQADLVFQPITPPDGTYSWEWKASCKEALTLATHRRIHHNETWRVIPQNHVLMGFK